MPVVCDINGGEYVLLGGGSKLLLLCVNVGEISSSGDISAGTLLPSSGHTRKRLQKVIIAAIKVSQTRSEGAGEAAAPLALSAMVMKSAQLLRKPRE